MTAGVWAAIGCFSLWGFLPLYLKLLDQTAPTEILAHRVVWSLLFLVLLLTVRRHWQWVRKLVASPRLLVLSAACALLLSTNWLIFIWAINQNYIIEASLGYFINPLLNVALGMLLLGERLRPVQWLALAIACAGVLYMTAAYGKPPWIALGLAFSFGIYGLLRKQSRLSSIEGLSLETAIILLPALAYLGYLSGQSSLVFGQTGWDTDLLLIGTGIATALPLLLFAYAAQRTTLTQLGLLQYIGPSIQMLVGIYLFGQSFAGPKVVGFSLIWLALVIYSVEGLIKRRGGQRAVPGD